MLEKSDIEKLAQLARIDLSEDEKTTFLKEIDPILGYIGTLKDVVSSSGAERRLPEHRNITRADISVRETGLETEAIVHNFPESKDTYLKVKKILS